MLVYLNGECLPIEKAKVSVLDRGFTFGDAIYEVIPVYGEHIFRLNEHLDRLSLCLSEIFIENPLSHQQWTEIFREVLARNPGEGDHSLYVQVSRGVGEREHKYTPDMTPTVLVICRPVTKVDYSQGVKVITHEDIRWQYCHIKATTLLASVLLKKYADEYDGSLEAILHKDGIVTEGASSNVFVVKDSRVLTPAKNGKVLPGITRDLVVELLQYSDIPCIEGDITLVELMSADEIWISSSTMGVAAVISIDGHGVSGGKPGPMWMLIDKCYQTYKAEPGILDS